MKIDISRRELGCLLGAALTTTPVRSQSDRSEVTHSGDSLSLGNSKIAIEFRMADSRLRATNATRRSPARTLALPPDLFVLTLEGGRVLRSSELPISGPPNAARVGADSKSIRRAGRRSGQTLSANFRDESSGATIRWRAVLLDGSAYLRQEVIITAGAKDLPVLQIALWDGAVDGATVIGTVKGSPAVTGPFFLGFEHPLATNTVNDGDIECALARTLPLEARPAITYSAVIGCRVPEQMRRDFLRLRRARARASLPHVPALQQLVRHRLLQQRYDAGRRSRPHPRLRRRAARKRGVTLDSFLFDDGWDDTSYALEDSIPASPTASRRCAKAAAEIPRRHRRLALALGRLRPPPSRTRIAFGNAAGLRNRDGGFALSGPQLLQRFSETCLEMIDKYGVNQFKFDGTGNVNNVVPGQRIRQRLRGRHSPHRPTCARRSPTSTST